MKPRHKRMEVKEYVNIMKRLTEFGDVKKSVERICYLSGIFSKYWGKVSGMFSLLRLKSQTFGGDQMWMVEILQMGGHPCGWLRLGSSMQVLVSKGKGNQMGGPKRSQHNPSID